MADAKTTTTAKAPAASSKQKEASEEDLDAAVIDAIDNLREAMLEAGMDETTVDAKLMAVQPNQTNLVGNFADLQRIGAMLVTEEGGIADAVLAPAEPASEEAEKSAGAVE